MDATIAPIDLALKLTRLMHASAALKDWPRMNRLSVRREQLMARMTTLPPADPDKLGQIRAMDADIRRQVSLALESVQKRWHQLKYSRQAVGVYYTATRR